MFFKKFKCYVELCFHGKFEPSLNHKRLCNVSYLSSADALQFVCGELISFSLQKEE